jgi:DMSO/TMAO reductase YedYZ molybdopterin-dependent catalytic subunit
VSEDDAPVGRRFFLGLIGLGAIGVVAGSRISDGLSRAAEPVTKNDPTGLSSILPTENFRYYTVTNSFPKRRPEDWTLTVGGLVEKQYTLTYADLLALPAVGMTKDFQCVTGWRVRDVKWRGVRVSTLLDKAKVKTNGAALRFTCFDGAYTESLTMEQARRDDVIVAYEMEGKPVTSDHGGPVRLYVAPMYGYKSAKWLEGIEVTDEVIPGYWEELGYDVDAWVGRSNGRDDAPTS